MSTPCPTTSRPCATPGCCSQPAGCVLKAPVAVVTRCGQPLPVGHQCSEQCQLLTVAGTVHPHCQDSRNCHLWPDTDLDKAAVQSLADHLLQRTPEQERQQRAWMFGDWTLELSDTEPGGVVTRSNVRKALDNVDFVAKVRDAVYAKPNVRRCTMGVGCEEVGQCYVSAHGEPDRCGVPEAAPFDQAAWEHLGTTLRATCDSNPPATCPWDQWKSSRGL